MHDWPASSMIMLCLRFNLSDAGARNATFPRLGLITLDEDFFVLTDGMQDRRVVLVAHQAPDLAQCELEFCAQAVASLPAQLHERDLPAGAAEGRDGHVVLVGYLHEDFP